jgi:hypothetical protein
VRNAPIIIDQIDKFIYKKKMKNRNKTRNEGARKILAPPSRSASGCNDSYNLVKNEPRSMAKKRIKKYFLKETFK